LENAVKKFFLAAITIVAGVGSSFAADMADRSSPPGRAAPLGVSWTGAYLGLNGGYGWQTDDPNVTLSPADSVTSVFTCGGVAGGSCPRSASYGLAGGVFGLQAGYDFQFNTKWVAGLVADLDWTNIDGSGTGLPFGLAATGANLQSSEQTKWFGTIRARLGYLLTDNVLVYGTGGLAYGRVNETASVAGSGSGVSGPTSYMCGPGGIGSSSCFLGSASQTNTGWTAGTGFEYRFWQRFSITAEYLYVSLGHGDPVNVAAAQILTPGTAPASFTANFGNQNFQVFRAGLNYRFGTP
jgi:outer membrane immunogenic protein